LREVAVDLAAQPWIGEAPIIADRALGNYASLELLASTGRAYLVPVPEHEIPAWVPELRGLPLDVEDRDGAVQAVERLGLARVDAKTFVADGATFAGEEAAPEPAGSTEQAPAPTRIAAALAKARLMKGGGSSASLAAQHGMSKSHVTKLLSLLQLPLDVQMRIQSGEGADLALSGLTGSYARTPMTTLAARRSMPS
jgi:hypothetical protein